MTSLSSSASTSAKTVNNNAQKNISVSVCEKNALTAVNGRKKRKQGRLRDFCIVFLSVVIAFCTGIMLFCGYAMTQRNQNRPNRPSTEVQTSLTVTKIKPVPRIISVSVAEELNADFTRNVAIECRNDDGTTDGLYYSYNGDSDRKRLEGGKAVLALPKGSYIITVTNDSGKAVQSDEFTINVDAVTKITIDKTDTYMNVGMTGTLTTAFETIGNPTDSEKSVKWNSSAPKTVSVKDGVITALKAGTATITASVSDSISDSIEITVTDLLRAPKITATKPLLQPGQYSEAEGSMIDAVLESRVNTAGYGTRAGVMSDTDSTFNFVIAMLQSQLFNLLCDKADDEYNGKLPVHVRFLLDEFANIGQIPRFDKLIATIRSREMSASIILQSQSQLKAIYKDAAEIILDNADSTLFLGGRGKNAKDISDNLGRETIDSFNTSENRGTQVSHGLTYQKLGKELMTQDEIAVMDGGKCILQLRGVRPFLSDKYDITKHPNYKYLSDFDKKNAFDVERYMSTRPAIVKPDEAFDIYEIDLSDEDAAAEE